MSALSLARPRCAADKMLGICGLEGRNLGASGLEIPTPLGNLGKVPGTGVTAGQSRPASQAGTFWR